MKNNYLTRKDFNITSNIYNLSNFDPAELEKFRIKLYTKIRNKNNKKTLTDKDSLYLPFYIKNIDLKSILLGRHYSYSFEYTNYLILKIFFESLGIIRFDSTDKLFSSPSLISDVFSKECIKSLSLNLKESKIITSNKFNLNDENTKKHLTEATAQYIKKFNIALTSLDKKESLRRMNSYSAVRSQPFQNENKIDILKDNNFKKKNKTDKFYNGISTISINFTFLELLRFLISFIADMISTNPFYLTIINEFLRLDLRSWKYLIKTKEIKNILNLLINNEIDLKEINDLLDNLYGQSRNNEQDLILSKYNLLKKLNNEDTNKIISLTFVFFIEDISLFVDNKEYKSTHIQIDKNACIFNPFGYKYNYSRHHYNLPYLNPYKLFLSNEISKAKYNISYFGDSTKNSVFLKENILNLILSKDKKETDEFYFSEEDKPGINIETFKDKIDNIDSKLGLFFVVDKTRLLDTVLSSLLDIRKFLTASYINDSYIFTLLSLLFDFPSLTDDVYDKILSKFKDYLIEKKENSQIINKLIYIFFSVRFYSRINNRTEKSLREIRSASKINTERTVIYNKIYNIFSEKEKSTNLNKEFGEVTSLLLRHYTSLKDVYINRSASGYIYIKNIELFLKGTDLSTNTEIFSKGLNKGYKKGILKVYGILSNKVLLSKLLHLKESEQKDDFFNLMSDYNRIVEDLSYFYVQELEELYIKSENESFELIGELLTIMSISNFVSHVPYTVFTDKIIRIHTNKDKKPYIDKENFIDFFTNQTQLFPISNV